jgi:quercetin dioxygenase-like cupin family protein
VGVDAEYGRLVRLSTVAVLLLASLEARAQNVMQYGVKHLTVLAENDQVRVLKYAPHKGDKTPMHSHPASVLYVIKGGRISSTLPDGSTSVGVLKTGEALIRPPTTHEDEALDDVEAILMELKPGPATSAERTMLDFATRYTAAWCSGRPEQVASFFSPKGSLTINDGKPSIGRAEIATAAQGFMAAFPDLVVRMDGVSIGPHGAVYRWTLTGTNTGPGGTGRPVRISGYEEWMMSEDGLVEKSLGHFNRAEYERQIKGEASLGK